MKKPRTFSLSSFLFAIIFAGSFSSSYASHIVGGDLYYTNVSGSTYKITLALYGDCGIASAAAFSTLPTSTPQLCIYSGDTSVATITLSIDSPSTGVEVTPLCAGDSSQCTSPAATIPGVKKFVYSTTYTFSHTSTVWRIIYTGNNVTGSLAGRAAAITNITDAGGAEMQLMDTLNNTIINSNPILTVTQQTYFCANQHDTYNPTALDPDHDSLSIDLISAGMGTTNCSAIGGDVAYTGAAWPGTTVSAADPLQVDATDSFSMNSTTGEMYFHPLIQRAVVVYNIREFRAGSLVGSSQREMTVLVVVCDTAAFPCMYVASPVTGSGITSVSKVNEVKIYPNPATEELTINTLAGAYNSFSITNAIGKVFLYSPLTVAQTSISLATLPAGLYYIVLNGEQGVNVRKFVKM